MPKPSSPIADQVYAALSTYLRRDTSTLHPDDSLRDDVGLDSLMTIELLYEIESIFDLQIPDEDFVHLGTIGDVIAYIEKRTRPVPRSRRARPSPPPQKKKPSTKKLPSIPPSRKPHR